MRQQPLQPISLEIIKDKARGMEVESKLTISFINLNSFNKLTKLSKCNISPNKKKKIKIE